MTSVVHLLESQRRSRGKSRVQTTESMGGPIKTGAQVVDKPSARERSALETSDKLRHMLSRVLLSNPARKGPSLLEVRLLGFEPNKISVRCK